MNNFSSLIKVQLFSTLKLNKIIKAKPEKKAIGIFSLVAFALFFVALIGGIGYLYSWIFAQAFIFNLDLLVPQMFSISALVCLVFSFYSAGGLLYGNKDFDLLSSLPIKKHTIVLSKLAFSYILDFLFGLLFVVPAFIAYAQYGGVITAEKIIRTALMLIFMPIVPTAISIVLSAQAHTGKAAPAPRGASQP